MVARITLLVGLLASSSYAFASIQQPTAFSARSTALRMSGGDAPLDLKVSNYRCDYSEFPILFHHNWTLSLNDGSLFWTFDE